MKRIDEYRGLGTQGVDLSDDGAARAIEGVAGCVERRKQEGELDAQTIARRQLEGTAKAIARFLEAIDHVERVAQVVQRLDGIIADRQRFAETGNRLVEAAQTLEDRAEVVVGLGVGGIERERRLVMLDRGVERAELLEHVAQIVVQAGVVGLDLERRAIRVDRLVEQAEPVQRCAKVVEHADMPRILAQNLLIQRLRHHQAACLMVFDGGFE